MKFLASLVIVGSTTVTSLQKLFPDVQDPKCQNLEFYSREDWKAEPYACYSRFNGYNVKQLYLHHTVSPTACYNNCLNEVKSMQNYHKNTLDWCDIGYSWILGSDGKFYEGRGWEAVGAHTPGFNDWAYALTIIGDYTHRLPPAWIINRIEEFKDCAIKASYLRDSVELRGHRNALNTECPGDQLYHYLNNFESYQPGPTIYWW